MLDDVTRTNTLHNWIVNSFIPRKTPNNRWTSYGLKSLAERELRCYISNDEFKTAMRRCGFYPVNQAAHNWVFCISEKSPALKSWRNYQNHTETRESKCQTVD